MILYDRQLGLFDPTREENQWPIVIVGAGTVGSWTALALAKMGLQRITLIDFDRVEAQNIPNQFYTPAHVGELKAYMLAKQVREYTDVQPRIYEFPFGSCYAEAAPPIPGLVLICTADNMEVRKEMWEYVKRNPNANLYVDARTGGNAAKIYAIPPMLAYNHQYSGTLHSDDLSTIRNEEVRNLSDVPCTMRSIVDVSLVVAGAITNIVRLYITSGKAPYETVIDMANGFTLMTK